MNIIVTGGSGFIGRHLIKQLEDNGETVVNVAENVQVLPDESFKNCKTIYHLGAIPRMGYSLEHPEEVLLNNYEATLRVLEAARLDPTIVVVNVSSSSVEFANLRENPYALSKKFGEDLTNLYLDTYGICASNVRLYNVYGPGEADYGKHTTLVKACKKRVIAGQNLKINGDGSILRDYTHVSDVVNGLIAVERAIRMADALRTYELGANNPVSVLDVVNAFREGANLGIDFAPHRDGDAPFTIADPSLRPTGWYPVFDVLDYIQDWKAEGCPDD